MASNRPVAFPNFHNSRKRQRCSHTNGRDRFNTEEDEARAERDSSLKALKVDVLIETPTSPLEAPNDTKATLLYIKSTFPVQVFAGKIPAIMLKHQVYSILKDKTLVDRQLNALWDKNEIRMFKITSGSDEFAIIFTEDYVEHIRKRIQSPDVLQTVEAFVNTVLPNCIDVSVTRTALTQKFKLADADVTKLVNAGVLTVRDVGSWWLAIPSAGIFMKNFVQGRKALVRMIKQRKYKEILERDLESRNLNCHSKLGMIYHIHDIVGADIVKSIETTSGRLLRLDLET